MNAACGEDGERWLVTPAAAAAAPPNRSIYDLMLLSGPTRSGRDVAMLLYGEAAVQGVVGSSSSMTSSSSTSPRPRMESMVKDRRARPEAFAAVVLPPSKGAAIAAAVVMVVVGEKEKSLMLSACVVSDRLLVLVLERWW